MFLSRDGLLTFCGLAGLCVGKVVGSVREKASVSRVGGQRERIAKPYQPSPDTNKIHEQTRSMGLLPFWGA